MKSRTADWEECALAGATEQRYGFGASADDSCGRRGNGGRAVPVAQGDAASRDVVDLYASLADAFSIQLGDDDAGTSRKGIDHDLPAVVSGIGDWTTIPVVEPARSAAAGPTSKMAIRQGMVENNSCRKNARRNSRVQLAAFVAHREISAAPAVSRRGSRNDGDYAEQHQGAGLGNGGDVVGDVVAEADALDDGNALGDDERVRTRLAGKDAARGRGGRAEVIERLLIAGDGSSRLAEANRVRGVQRLG